MTLLPAVAAAGGLGLCLVASAWWTGPEPLDRLLSRGRATAAPVGAPAGGTGRAREALGQLGRRLDLLLPGNNRSTRAQDLAVLGLSPASVELEIGVAAALGIAAAPAVSAALVLVGMPPPPAVPLLGCLALGAGAVLAYRARLRRRARGARAELARCLASFLELVSLAQAAGMGVEGALDAASSASDAWPFVALRRAFVEARHKGRTVWEAFSSLGSELGSPELEELGASLALAGREGARVRATLAARAASLRSKELARQLAAANALTERLFLPTIFLMLGFLVYLLYPAVATVARLL
jgi:tight adherence protein C